MTAPLIHAALTLAEMVPSITRWFKEDKEKVGMADRISTKVVDIAKKVTGTEDAVSALQLLEKEPRLLIRFQQEVLRLDRDLELSFLEDRQDARHRDIALISAGRYNVRADIMVVAAALGLMGCLASLTYFRDWLPGEAVGIISTIAGIFGSCLKDAYAFEFGSSRGSKTKDEAVLMGAVRR
jgi:hypothetical protein